MKTPTHKTWVTAAIAAILLIGIATAPAVAHHSFAMYDTAVKKTMTGKLIRFVVGANHSQYVMEVVNPDGTPMLNDQGKPVTWTVETGAASQLSRQGITVETFKVGSIFTITFSPLRDGRNGGAQQGALILCGMKLPEGGCTEQTGKRFSATQ
jgi:hypothetical protein